MANRNILIVTGHRQIGKSTVCRRAVACMKQAGLQVSGVLTARTGPHDLSVTELHTGAVYPLTAPFTEPLEPPEQPDRSVAMPHLGPRNFIMDTEAMARSSAALERALPTQVFVVDELGPLELCQRKGWIGVLDLLQREDYELGILVVRPELLGDLVMMLPFTHLTVVSVTPANRDYISTHLCEMARQQCGVSQSRSNL